MKKIILLILLWMTCTIIKPNHLWAQGLMSKLIEIKYRSELYLTRNPKNDTNLAVYNTLRWQMDALVYQLSAEMINANSPRKFHLLNKWCLEASNDYLKKPDMASAIKIHQQALEQINDTYQTYIVKKDYPVGKNINLSTNIFYLLKDSYTIINGLSDLKTKKTMALIELMDHARLLSPLEVMKQGR